MLILKVTSLLTQSLANIMKPIYADHIGSVLQFYFFQNIALDTKKAKRSPFTHMTAADIYSLTYRHSDTLEAASAAFLYDLPFGIYSLFKTISYTKIDRKEYAITSLTIVTLFMVV
ncbi:hypothetical protein ECANGB1_343 [Enterospora canceri]|uniref:Uncharacterized protein n=1 Tax=Enterospora canceri TaxID=1081671 RepID=A0A1Y1S3K9_9MICR|nr:hypothetical protein ECANGB1_343 [Enterospora canceri]